MQREPQGTRISSTVNLHGYGMKYRKATAALSTEPMGICIAMTVQWIRGIYERNELAYDPGTPPYHTAAVLQGYYERGPAGYTAKLKRLMEVQNLEAFFNPYSGTCRDAFAWIRKMPELQAFLIEVPGHAIAGFYLKPQAYYFDPNWGVYEYNTINDFCTRAYFHCRTSYCAMPGQVAPNDEVLVRQVNLDD